MVISFQTNGEIYRINADHPLDISIPLVFGGAQPNAYGVEKASATPCETGELVGDTRRGGSCNFEQYKFIPHCNGTHTECVGHLTRARISVRECLRDAFVPVTLISVEPEKFSETNESYAVRLKDDDQLITRESLEKRLLNSAESEFLDGLIIRTAPNDTSKLSRTYLEEIPPFFSTEAMNFINEIGARHLLVDMPSIDRIYDEGKLSNHRIFWKIAPGSDELNKDNSIHKTITELIYVSEEIEDGKYLLNLQIAPFAADASPSRPLLFPIFR